MPVRLPPPSSPAARARWRGTGVCGALAVAASGLGLAPPAARAADLVHLEVQGARDAGGSSTDMEFHEVERGPEVSRARVLAGTSGGAALPLFLLRGFCVVAESRGTRYFLVRPEPDRSDGDALYTAEFADERVAVTPARPRGARGLSSASPDGVYAIDDCRLAGFVR